MNNALNNDASWIRDLWIGSFTGICGSALMWDNMHKRELWPHFGRLRAFVAGYDFDESNGDQKGWIPYHDFDEMHYENWQRKPGIVDLVYLRSPDKQRAVGVLANRTYNFYTQWDVTKCGAFVWSGEDEDGDGRPNSQEDFEMTDNSDTWDDQAYNSAHTAYYINESLQVDVKSKKTYIVTYFNPFTLQVIGSEEKYNATGKLNLNFPFITGTASRPIILFTVEPKNKNKSTEQYLDSVRKEINTVANDLKLNEATGFAVSEARIFPNPAGEYINIELPENATNCRIELLSSTGMLVKSDEFSGISYKLSLEGIDTG